MSRRQSSSIRARGLAASERRSKALLALIVVSGLSVAGCPEHAAGPPETTAPCREVGQRCEFAPGKLGSCVVNDDCQGPNCFVCQSQH